MIITMHPNGAKLTQFTVYPDGVPEDVWPNADRK